jgi:hypothetical protein
MNPVSSFIAGWFGSLCPHRQRKVIRSGMWRGRPCGLKMPDFAPYDAALGNRVDDVAANSLGLLPGRVGPCAQRVHQVRPDLGRLVANAEILQIGPFLEHDPDPKGRIAQSVKRFFRNDHAQSKGDTIFTDSDASDRPISR